MDTNALTAPAKNRCISCVYLCLGAGNTLSDCKELCRNTRLQIIKGECGEYIQQWLMCYKGLARPEDVRRDARNTVCQSKGWQPHTEGKPPQMAFQIEQNSKTKRWIIVGVIISVLVLASTLFFGIYNLPSL